MAKLNKEETIKLIKNGLGFVVCSSTGAVSCGLMRTLVPPGVNIVVKSGMLLGGLLLSGFMSDKVVGYTDKQIDGIVKDISETVSEFKRPLDVILDKDIEEKTE